MSDPQDQVTAALGATRETKRIEFKSEFDPDLPGAWCELLKDIVAIANSGGGTILFGLDNSGRTCGWDARKLLDIDVADIANQLAKYTGEHFDDFTTHERIKSRKKIALMIVGARTGSPLVFVKPGTYSIEPGKQSTAFARGTIYFRHGAKSEPGTSKDIERFVNAEVARVRKDWLRNVRKVSVAPRDSEFYSFLHKLVLHKEQIDSELWTIPGHQLWLERTLMSLIHIGKPR
jgi:predicted HTH transcriptional regulator